MVAKPNQISLLSRELMLLKNQREYYVSRMLNLQSEIDFIGEEILLFSGKLQDIAARIFEAEVKLHKALDSAN